MYYLFLFSPSHLASRGKNANAKSSTCVYLCTLKASFFQVEKLPSPLPNYLRGFFSVFLPKIKNSNPIWPTIGDGHLKMAVRVLEFQWISQVHFPLMIYETTKHGSHFHAYLKMVIIEPWSHRAFQVQNMKFENKNSHLWTWNLVLFLLDPYHLQCCILVYHSKIN